MRDFWTYLSGNKQVSGKALLILTVVLALFGGGVYLLHGYQVRRNAHGLLEQARIAEDEGNKAQAVQYLDQYVGLAPDDTEALAKLALLLNEQAKSHRARMRAFYLFDQVLRRDAQRDDIRRALVRLATQVGRYSDGSEHLEVLLKAAPTADVELLFLSARCQAGLNHFDRAADLYRQAIALAPERSDIALEYAGVLRSRLQLAESADAVIEHMVQRDRRSRQIRLDAAQYFARFGQWERAWPHVRFILEELGPPNDEVLLLAADVALNRGEMDQARKLYEQGQQLFPEDARMGRGLAEVEVRKGDHKKALALLERSLQQLPKDPQELVNLANLLISAGAIDQARAIVVELGKGTASAPVRFLEARLLMRKGDWGEAANILERVRTDRRFPLGKHANLLLAECYEHLLNPDQRLEALRRALELDPAWLIAGRAYAGALVAAGKLDLAIAELRKWARQAPTVKEDLARLLVAANLRLPESQRDWSEINRLLDELPPESRNSLEVALFRSEILASQGKFAEARKLAEAERDRDPKQVAPWLLLIALADRSKSGPTPAEIAAEAERRAGPRVEWPLLRLRLALQAGDAAAKVQLPKILGELESFQDKERERLLAGLAEAYAAVGEPALAQRLWSEQADRNRDDLRVRFLLFETALQAKQVSEMQRLLGQIRRIEGGEGAFTAYGEAALCLVSAEKGDKSKLAEARPFLTRAAALRPSWSRVPLMEAVIFELEGQKEKALDKYRAALERGEARMHIARRTLQLMHEQRLYAEANALLRKLPEQALATPELGRMAQLTLLSTRADGQDAEASRQQALQLARKAAADSKDHRDHLWLGHIASLTGDAKEAEKALRQACTLKETAPEAWAALVLFLARSDAKKAAVELAEAQRRLPKEQGVLILAVASEALGDAKKAEECYQTMLEAKPNDPMLLRESAAFLVRQGQLAKAETTLHKLLAAETRAPEASVAWARRSLSFILAIQGGHDRFKQAEAILKEGSKDGVLTRDDRLIRALILATQPARRREAIQAIETLSPNLAAMPDELRFLLAQLYEADGNWQTAELHLLAVLRSQERNLSYLDRYISGLLRQRKGETAQVWVEKLAQIAPKSLRTLDLRVHVHKAAGTAAEGIRLVEEYARAKDARLDVAGAWFEVLGEQAQAEKAYRGFAAASKQPDSALVLALHLGRQSKVAEALAICEEAWKTCQPEAVAGASVSVLRAAKAAPEQWQRVEGWLIRAIEKSKEKSSIEKANKSVVLPLYLAEVYEQLSRPADAVRIYRELLARDGRNVVALNNLAYLLALREGAAAEALTLMNRAIEAAGPVDELLDTRAVVYLQNQQADLAIRDLEQAIAQAPKSTRYFHLAQAQHMANNKGAARQAWGRARDLGFQEADVHPLERAGWHKLVAELN